MNDKTSEPSHPFLDYVKSQGPLYELLDSKLLRLRTKQGFLDTNELAGIVGTTRQYVYKRFAQCVVPPKWVVPLIEASRGRLTLEEILPFVIPGVEPYMNRDKK